MLDKMNLKKGICSLICIVLLCACNKNPHKNVDLSGVHFNLQFSELDTDLFAAAQDIKQALPSLLEKHPKALPIFTTEVIKVGYPEDAGVDTFLHLFLHDTTIVDVKKKVDKLFDKGDLKDDLEDAFLRYKYYFPNNISPEVFTCISGFNQSMVMTDSLMGIGLDKYLGRNCNYYHQLAISNFEQMNMYPEKVVPDAVYAWAMTQHPFKGYGSQLIDKMIYEGKLLYILDACVPDVPDTVKVGYTLAQFDFCVENEANMWRYLAEQKMLFSSNRMDVVRFTGDAPYTTPFGNESPGRTGNWLGWQIVRSYMQNNKTVSIEQLMQEKDARAILRQSAYAPK